MALVASLDVLLPMVCVGAPQDAGKGESAKLQGTWVGVSAEEAGQKGDLKQGKIVFEGDQFTAWDRGRVLMKGTFHIDSAKRPGAIDLNSTAGRNRGQTAEGIYELTGDTLRLALVDPGKTRPTKFSSEGGLGHHVLIYKRQKSD